LISALGCYPEKKWWGGNLMPVIMTSLIVVSLGCLALYLGLKLARAMREQFEELMPQRMVDYSGFVDLPRGRD
jgi:hypothetical protein